jgi:hypothetical protein
MAAASDASLLQRRQQARAAEGGGGRGRSRDALREPLLAIVTQCDVEGSCSLRQGNDGANSCGDVDGGGEGEDEHDLQVEVEWAVAACVRVLREAMP